MDKTALTEADGRIYAGCYVNFNVDIWAQDGQYTGIRCSLNGVQFVKDGDAFGGAAACPRTSSRTSASMPKPRTISPER